MPDGDRLLDTSIVVALFNNDLSVRQRLTDVRVYLSPIVIGELMFGAKKSARVAENVARILEFAGAVQVQGVTAATATHYGELKELLRAAGRPIPDNDLWIAATALEHGLTLVTRDRHFEGVPGLVVDRW